MTTNRRSSSPEELFEKAQAGRRYWLDNALDEYDLILLLPHEDERLNIPILEAFAKKLLNMPGPAPFKSLVLSVSSIAEQRPLYTTAVISKNTAGDIITLYSMYEFTDKLFIGSWELPYGRNAKRLLESGLIGEKQLCDCILDYAANEQYQNEQYQRAVMIHKNAALASDKFIFPQSRLSDLSKRGHLDNKAVFIFGHSNNTLTLISRLSENNVKIEAILDNDKTKYKSCAGEPPVKNPVIMQNYTAADSIVLIVSRHFCAMAKQLRELGYKGEIHNIILSLGNYSLSKEIFSQEKKRVMRGAAVLKKIKNQFPAQHLVIFTVYGFGDLYWTFSFLPAYCEKHGINEVVIPVFGDISRPAQISELFTDNIAVNMIPLEYNAIKELIQAVIFLREENSLIIQHCHPKLYTGFYTDDKNDQPFINVYRCSAYGLDKNTRPALPGGQSVFSRPELIEKGKTVILAPYANFYRRLPDIFWEKLAAEYRQKGYLVCTNVAGNQAPVKNTRPLSVPINQIIAAAEYAGCFIGLRSGLCDILATANCRKIVVFPMDTGYGSDKIFSFLPDDIMPGWEKILYKR